MVRSEPLHPSGKRSPETLPELLRTDNTRLMQGIGRARIQFPKQLSPEPDFYDANRSRMGAVSLCMETTRRCMPHARTCLRSKACLKAGCGKVLTRHGRRRHFL